MRLRQSSGNAHCCPRVRPDADGNAWCCHANARAPQQHACAPGARCLAHALPKTRPTPTRWRTLQCPDVCRCIVGRRYNAVTCAVTSLADVARVTLKIGYPPFLYHDVLLLLRLAHPLHGRAGWWIVAKSSANTPLLRDAGAPSAWRLAQPFLRRARGFTWTFSLVVPNVCNVCDVCDVCDVCNVCNVCGVSWMFSLIVAADASRTSLSCEMHRTLQALRLPLQTFPAHPSRARCTGRCRRYVCRYKRFPHIPLVRDAGVAGVGAEGETGHGGSTMEDAGQSGSDSEGQVWPSV